jgi:hypothetical protein
MALLIIIRQSLSFFVKGKLWECFLHTKLLEENYAIDMMEDLDVEKGFNIYVAGSYAGINRLCRTQYSL